MKKLYAALGVVVVALIIIFFATRTTHETSAAIRVGAIIPLSGELGYMGEAIERGMQLALEDNYDVAIELSIQDDKSLDSKGAVNGLNTLLAQGYDDVILDMAVNTTKSLSPIVESREIPLVVLWDSSNELLNLSDWVFAMGFSVEAAGEDVATLAYEDFGLRTMGIVNSQDEWAAEVAHSFQERFEALGGTIVLHEEKPIGEADFRTQIAKGKNLGAESFYAPIYAPGSSSFFRQARELGYKGPLFTGDVFSDIDVEALGELSENIYLAQLWLDDAEFKHRYEQTYGLKSDPTNLAFAAIGYDGIKLVATVYRELRAAGIDNPTNEDVREHMKTLRFQGITGLTEFDSEGRSHKRERLLKVSDGEFLLVR